MVTFRNNRRGRFRGGDRNFKRNNAEPHKFKSDFSTNTNFHYEFSGQFLYWNVCLHWNIDSYSKVVKRFL